MATAQNVFPKVGNDPLYDSEINRFNNVRTNILYTDTGFDSTQTNAGSNVDSDVIGSMTANELIGGSYVKIGILGTIFFDLAGGASAGSVSLKIETAPLGGASGISLDWLRIASDYGGDNQSDGITVTYPFIWYHTITQGESLSGISIICNSNSEASASVTTSFTNIQTVGEVI